MFEQITTVFFDVGDTLYVCPPMEKEYPNRLVALLALSRGVAVEDARRLLSDTVRDLNERARNPTKVRAMEELGFTRSQVHEAFCRVNPSEYLSSDRRTATVIRALATSYKLGVISNFKRIHLDHILAVLGLSSSMFGCGIVSEDMVEEIKPAREPFLKAVELSGDRPEQCLFVGNSIAKDMRPARQVGMATVLVKASPTSDDLRHADASVADVNELPLLLPRITVYPEGCVHGRFQPPHDDHLQYILTAKRRCEFLWVGITRPDARNQLPCPEAPHRAGEMANPLSFFERVQIITEMLVDVGVPRNEFSCVPFPIDEPELLPDFMSRSIPCFTTIYDNWNREKIERLRTLSQKVIVLKEGREEEKGIRGEKIRAYIRDGNRDWENLVPPATRRAVYRLDVRARLESVS